MDEETTLPISIWLFKLRRENFRSISGPQSTTVYQYESSCDNIQPNEPPTEYPTTTQPYPFIHAEERKSEGKGGRSNNDNDRTKSHTLLSLSPLSSPTMAKTACSAFLVLHGRVKKRKRKYRYLSSTKLMRLSGKTRMRTKNKKKGFQKKKNQKDAHRPFSHPTQYAIEMRIIVNTYTALLSHTKVRPHLQSICDCKTLSLQPIQPLLYHSLIPHTPLPPVTPSHSPP